MDESARRDLFRGRVILAPMTKGSNLPFRRLCLEQGARFAVGEMALSKRVVKGASGELALLRRHPDEPVFGVQLCGRHPDLLQRAAVIAQERGADFVDLNLGCPIETVIRRGEGAALLTRPRRVGQLVAAMRKVLDVGLTVKLRTGWSEDKPTALAVAREAEAEGADAVVLHARSRTQRYRRQADWSHVRDLVENLSIPVVGNGDISNPADMRARIEETGCASVMIARAALIKPWIFREIVEKRDLAPTAEERLALLRRYVELAREHFGEDERGLGKVRFFLDWHLDFLCRWLPPRPGLAPFQLQERHPGFEPADETEALLARSDRPGRDYLVRLLVDGPEAAGAAPPLPPEGWDRGGRDHRNEVSG
ncbi:MAG: tRNA-dihydrouridine synthase family protein [Acidobacteriota bacterium]